MNNDLISRSALKKVLCEKYEAREHYIGEKMLEAIDNAPTVEVEFELKTENGITYPKALEHMTFTHTLSIEERQNIIEAYMLGANSNIRPQGEWVYDPDHSVTIDVYKCSVCSCYGHTHFNFCPKCGADMRKGNKE